MKPLLLLRRLALLLAVLLGLAPAVGAVEPTVLLVSMDGTPADAVETAGLATLGRLAREGARGRLVPVFPSNTFPNHVSFVTGVAPEVHGVVNNVFLDPERGLHRYASDPTWSETEPLWSILARRGIPSAAFHWVGSEGPWRSGLGPRHWRPFDASTPEQEKVAQMLAWLDLPDPAQRPRLITSYFRGGDDAAHRHGADSPRVATALRGQDRALERLVAGVAARGLWSHTTLLVVSDHGSLPVERAVDLAGALTRAGLAAARVLGGGGFASVVAPAESVEAVLAVARESGLQAWRREQAPAGLRVAHPRFGAVVVVAPPGTAIGSPGGGARLAAAFGFARLGMRAAHGYPPGAPGLEALFVAYGRAVPAGTEVGRVSALDVAPTVLALLGVPIPDAMEAGPIAALVAKEESGVEN